MLAVLLWTGLLVAGASASATGRMTAENGLLRLETGTQRLTSHDLVGSVLVVPVGHGAQQTLDVRVDAVHDGAVGRDVPLHELSIVARDGTRRGYCALDARGRNAAYALRGRIDETGHFVPDASSFFFACTSGAVGKCVLWGYDPWAHLPDGRSLAVHYNACLRMVRADYLGDGEAHTRDGTRIDVADDVGVRDWTRTGGAHLKFEAGWGPRGAVCVSRVRWPDLADRRDLYARRPDLRGRCDRAGAARRGALLFSRVVPQAASGLAAGPWPVTATSAPLRHPRLTRR